MKFDIKKIEELIKVFEDSSLTEITITEDKNQITLSRQQNVQVTTAAPAYAQAPMVAPAAAPVAQAPAAAPAEAAKPAEPTGHKVLSPMVGTFYRRATPDAKPFVEVGSTVKKGDALCIVEAMKMMNKIEADKDGVIKAILVEDAHLVEFDQPLFIIE